MRDSMTLEPRGKLLWHARDRDRAPGSLYAMALRDLAEVTGDLVGGRDGSPNGNQLCDVAPCGLDGHLGRLPKLAAELDELGRDLSCFIAVAPSSRLSAERLRQ